MVASALHRARAALDANDDEGALGALLEAWRETRSARIADLVDRVSERLVPHRPAVTGKTVKARTEAWLQRAAARSSSDVGALLAAPWPGTWKDAVAPMRALREFPPDPRIAMAFARLLEAKAKGWDSWPARHFWASLVRHIGELGDRRALPILRADLEQSRSRFWEAETWPIVHETMGLLDAPLLAEPDEGALAGVEAFFALAVSSEKAAVRGEAELLAAVYAAPDDDAPRAVYADWLLERGDPRGEFITLQLQRHAGRGTPAGARREAALLKKHGAGWAGPLHHLVHDELLRGFERGFLARVLVIRCVDDPAWATVRSLSFALNIAETQPVLAFPSLQTLREIHGSNEEIVAALPPRAALEEVDIDLDQRDDTEEVLEERRRIGTGAAFPNLRRLGFNAKPLARAVPLLDGVLGRRLEQITCYDDAPALGPFVRVVTELGLDNVSELRLVAYDHLGGEPWRFAIRRDPRTRRFTELTGVRHHSESGAGTAHVLGEALASLAPDGLTALAIDRSEPSNYDVAAIRELEAALARFPALARVEVPWQRIAPATPATDPDALPIVTELHSGAEMAGERFDAMWSAVHEPPIALVVDGYAVDRGAHQTVATDGLAEAKKALARKRLYRVDLYRTAARETHGVEIGKFGFKVRTPLGRDPESIERYLAWLARLVDELRFEGRVDFVAREGDTWRQQPHVLHLFSFDASVGWLWVLAPETDRIIPFAELEKVPSREGLAWLRVMRTQTTLIVLFGATAADIPTRGQLELLERAAFDVRWARFAETHGFVPQERFDAIVGPLLARHGFVRGQLEEWRAASQGGRLYAKEDRRVLFTPTPTKDDAYFQLTMQHGERARGFGGGGELLRAATAEQMDLLLARAAADLEQALPWFDEPEKPRKKR